MIDNFLRIIVIEPHADDAFLSLGGHIERWVKQGRIITIATCTEYMTRKEDRGRMSDAAAYAKAVKAKWCKGKLEELVATDQSVLHIVTLGITHPDHIDLAKRARQICPNLMFYIDQPYAIVLKNSELLTRATQGLLIQSFLKPSVRKYRHIPLFKHQAKFFHYNPLEKLRETFEIIVGGRVC